MELTRDKTRIATQSVRSEVKQPIEVTEDEWTQFNGLLELEDIPHGSMDVAQSSMGLGYPQARMIFAKEGNLIVGACFVADEYSPEKEADLNIYVHPDKRRQGIGRMMMDRAKQLIHEFGKTPVVHQHDAQSKDFYAEMGLKENTVDW